jgi:uncharacterized protein YcbX
VGTVSRLSVAPVKGLAQHHPDEIVVERTGVPGNRQFLLLDEGNRLFSGIRHGRLVTVVAEYSRDPDRLSLRFPDGTVVADEVRLGAAEVVDLWDVPRASHVVEGPFSASLSEFVGKPLRLFRVDEEGGAWDEHVVSMLSEGSLEEFERQSGHEGPVDGRRFRMLVTVGGVGPHEEDEWIGRRVRLGEAVVSVVATCVRCATTTQNPESGARDFDTLRLIPAYRGFADGKYVEFGVYADVEEPGRVRIGDPVEPV